MRRFGAGLMVAILTILSMGIALPAQAAGTCGGTQSNYYDGFNRFDQMDQNPVGVSTYIVVRGADLCSGNTTGYNTMSAWALITNNKGIYDYKYGQAGFIQRVNQPLQYFSEWYNGSSTDTAYYSNADSQVGVKHAFRVLYDSSCVCHRAYVDSHIISTSKFDVFTAFGQQPWSPQYDGEVQRFHQTDMPGRASSPATWSDIGIETYGGSLIFMPCGLVGKNDNKAAWGIHQSTCTDFFIWTI